jgi:hypothetical protein
MDKQFALSSLPFSRKHDYFLMQLAGLLAYNSVQQPSHLKKVALKFELFLSNFGRSYLQLRG